MNRSFEISIWNGIVEVWMSRGPSVLHWYTKHQIYYCEVCKWREVIFIVVIIFVIDNDQSHFVSVCVRILVSLMMEKHSGVHHVLFVRSVVYFPAPHPFWRIHHRVYGLTWLLWFFPLRFSVTDGSSLPCVGVEEVILNYRGKVSPFWIACFSWGSLGDYDDMSAQGWFAHH